MLNKSQPQARIGDAVDNVREIRPTQPNVVRIDAPKDADPLQSFKPEVRRWRALFGNRGALALIAGTVLVVGLTIGAAALYLGNPVLPSLSRASVPSLTGHVALNSRPEGVVVSVDGVGRGLTPVEVDLPPGSHDVVFAEGTTERRLTLKVEAGARISENVDLPNAAQRSGQLEVTSDPQGARVTIDGNAAGVTPLTIQSVAPGRHVIIVTQGETTVNRSVEVSSGASSSVFVALAARGRDGAGWFAVDSPVELRILENGQVLGLSGGAPLMLSAGRHQLELVNDSVEMHLTRTLVVDPGKSTRLSVPVPNGTIAVNASPWAEVFLDGKSIGTTPLGSIEVSVGSHELVARHPQLGEKRRSIIVGAQTPLRVSMDLGK
jgi:hypothetical protein